MDKFASPNRYAKRRPTKPNRIDLVPEEINNFIDDQGIRIRIVPSILCPNRKELGGTGHRLDCQLCFGDEAVDLRNECTEDFAVIQSIEHNKKFLVQGMWDQKDVQITLKSQIRVYYWWKIEVLDFSSVFNELVKRDDDDTDKLRYPPPRSCDTPFFLIDTDGNRFKKGIDYTIIQERFLKWTGASRPREDTLYSISYPILPTFRVLETLHENRYYNITSKRKDRAPINLPQQAIARWDYLARNSGNRELMNPEPT